MMQKEKINIFIIVPTYNGEKDVPAFFDTLKNSAGVEDVSVVVVDNHSGDETVPLIKQHFPQAHLICNTKNNGYARGCNQGMEYALLNGADFLFLTNQDISFSKDWLRPLLQYMEQHHHCAAVQPLIIIDQKGETIINSCGNALHYLGFGYTRGYGKKKSEWACATTSQIGYCSGAGVLVRSDVLRKVGLFDDSYFMYHEDSDLCWRLRIAGYQLAVCAESILFHRYEFSRSIQKFYYIERNRLMNVFKNYQIKSIFLVAPMLIFLETGMLFYSLLGFLFARKTIGFKEKIACYNYFFQKKTWSHIRRERRKIAALRRVSDKKLARYFVSHIGFQDIDNSLVNHIANPITKFYWFFVSHLL